MKIVQINAVNVVGSTGRNVWELHNYLASQGHESYVFCTNVSDEKNNIIKIGNNFDYKLHAMLSRLFGLQGYFSVNSTSKLLSQLDEISPDIIVLHNLHANYINLPKLLKYIATRNIATVVVLHDFWFMTGHCCHFTLDKCDKWTSECHDCPILHKYNRSYFFDNSRKIFNDKKRLFQRIRNLAVVGVSDWVVGKAKESPIFQNAKEITRIYNWVDTDIFKPTHSQSLQEKLGLRDEDKVVTGVASTWSNDKGLDIFIEIARQLPDWKIMLIGNLDSTDKLPSNIITPGLISDSILLAKHYSLSDFFLMPSVQETFGKVTAEALACGIPVITNDKTACPEIPGAECGFIIKDNKAELIIPILKKYKKDQRSQYHTMCRNRALTLFNMNDNLKKYDDLFHSLILPVKK